MKGMTEDTKEAIRAVALLNANGMYGTAEFLAKSTAPRAFVRYRPDCGCIGRQICQKCTPVDFPKKIPVSRRSISQ